MTTRLADAKLVPANLVSTIHPVRTRLNSEERRASIIEAARKLFSERGFRGTTTRELAAAVGVTEPVLYEHFKTKRDLYSAIIEDQASHGIETLTALSDRFTAINDDHGFFVALGMGIVDWYTKDTTFIRLLLFSSLEGHELKDLFHERSKVCFTIVSDYIRRRIEQGAMRQVDADAAARGYFGMIAHYALSGLLFGCAPLNKSPEQVVRDMADIFLLGMSKEHKYQ